VAPESRHRFKLRSCVATETEENPQFLFKKDKILRLRANILKLFKYRTILIVGKLALQATDHNITNVVIYFSNNTSLIKALALLASINDNIYRLSSRATASVVNALISSNLPSLIKSDLTIQLPPQATTLSKRR